MPRFCVVEEEKEEKLQQRVEQRKETLNSIALVRQGRKIIAKSIHGYSDYSQSQRLEEDSQVLGGSIAKPLTALALLMGIHDQVMAKNKETILSGQLLKQAMQEEYPFDIAGRLATFD